jgi:small subunit ribosomal protein S6
MDRYETAVILDLDWEEEEKNAFVERLEKIISDFSGEIFDREDWGIRKLAYRILKKNSGHYLFLRYTGKRGIVEELERVMGLNENVLRYLTTRFEIDIKGKYPKPPSIDEFIDRDITELQTLKAQWRRGSATPADADQKTKEEAVKEEEIKEEGVKEEGVKEEGVKEEEVKEEEAEENDIKRETQAEAAKEGQEEKTEEDGEVEE